MLLTLMVQQGPLYLDYAMHTKKVTRQKNNHSYRRLYLALIFFMGAMVGYSGAIYQVIPKQGDPSLLITDPASKITVHFSPGGNCTAFITQLIEQATHEILVQAYAFTSIAIAKALERASNRGISVKVLIDRSQVSTRGSQVKQLIKRGIPVRIDQVPGIAHNKVMIIDNTYVITGSFNFTQAAETKNAENVLTIQDPRIALIYKKNWQYRHRCSLPINIQ